MSKWKDCKFTDFWGCTHKLSVALCTCCKCFTSITCSRFCRNQKWRSSMIIIATRNCSLVKRKVETRNTNTSYTWIWAEAEIVLNLKQNNKHAKMIHLLCSYYMYTSINTECHCHVHNVIMWSSLVPRAEKEEEKFSHLHMCLIAVPPHTIDMQRNSLPVTLKACLNYRWLSTCSKGWN